MEWVAAGIDPGPGGEPFDDVFFRIFLEAIEPRLGIERPVYVVDWPASMAALSRVKRDDPRWAERFELYAGGLELANGFTELNDAAEQRARLLEERALRVRLGRPALPLDEPFLEAVGRMPDAGGVGVARELSLQQDLASVPVLFTTALSRPAVQELLGSKPVLFKPFSKRQLLSWVREATGRA